MSLISHGSFIEPLVVSRKEKRTTADICDTASDASRNKVDERVHVEAVRKSRSDRGRVAAEPQGAL